MRWMKASRFFALEPRLVRPGAIADFLVVEEVLRLLGVRQRLPFRHLLRLHRLQRRCLCVRLGLLGGLAVASTVATTVGISPPSVFPVRTLLRRIPSSRAFLIRSRSLRCDRPTLKE